MVPPKKKGPKVHSISKTKAYKRKYKTLPKHVAEDIENDLLKEMADGEYKPGRDLKLRQGTKKNQEKIYQVRLSQGYRLTFTFNNGTATFQLVGPHNLF